MRSHRLLGQALALIACFACSEPAPRVEPSPARAPEPSPVQAPPAEPATVAPAPQPTLTLPVPDAPPAEAPDSTRPEPAALDPGCALALRARLRKRPRSEYELEVEAHNRTNEPLRFTLPSRCPQGPFEFRGLTPDYDYYQSCAKGMCAEREPESFELAAGERRVLETASIAAKGGSNCQRPLAPARYEIRPVVPKLPFEVCVFPAILDLRE